MRHARKTIIAFAVLQSVPAFGAEEPIKIPAQVSALQTCRAKADAAERLACYDKAVDVLSAATASREIVVIDRAEVKTTRKGLFGFSLPKIGFLSGRAGDKEDERDESELTSTVTSSRQFNREYWRITLADGAIWETTSTSRGFDDPKPGASVTVERGSLGAYWLTVGKRGRVQARRIK
jgi:hypothetical protein